MTKKEKVRAMSKDITEDILLKAGFRKKLENIHRISYTINNVMMIYYISALPVIRSWECKIAYKRSFACADIGTIDHFNKLMELMDIDFKLKGE